LDLRQSLGNYPSPVVELRPPLFFLKERWSCAERSDKLSTNSLELSASLDSIFPRNSTL